MRRAHGAILLFAAASVSLLAQDNPARFQSGVDLISVTATVVDAEGQLVTGLPKEAFEIFEQGDVRPSLNSPMSACPSALRCCST